jgi:hypothetical protein
VGLAEASGAGLEPYRLAPTPPGGPRGRPSPRPSMSGFSPSGLLRGRGWLPDRDRLIIYALLAGLILVVFAAGLKGVGAVRPLFILGCVALAWRAWRVGPGLHIEVAIILFTLAPFLRRVVDLHAGFSANGLMLIGPLGSLMVALPELRGVLLQRRGGLGVYAPYAVMIGCILYGWSISAFQGDFLEASVGGAKMLAPLLYAMCLIQRPESCEEVIQSAARAFLFICPIVGLYAIYQYMVLPEWDRYWMMYSKMQSIGQPEARQVRVFGTMNSPASFAMFVSCGLLLFGFCRRGWVAALLLVPVCLGLLLTSVRTAWISVAIGVAYCFFFNATRSRALLLTLCLFGAGAAAMLLTPFGDMIATRFATLAGDPSQDGSGHERLLEYVHIYSDLDHYLFGKGLAGHILSLQTVALDGQLVASAFMMGIVVGNIHILAMIWAAAQALTRVEPNASPIWLAVAAVVIGNFVVIPLSIISSGEIAFLVWSLVALLTVRQPTRRQIPQPVSLLRSERAWERQAEAVARRLGHGR